MFMEELDVQKLNIRKKNRPVSKKITNGLVVNNINFFKSETKNILNSHFDPSCNIEVFL
jgi:hypothetical protein